jgi:hypothetical protein
VLYKDTATVEDEVLPHSEVWGKIIVAPGQKARRDTEWPPLFDEIRKGKAAGIIHVTAYGYHSIRRGISLESTEVWHRVPEDERSPETFLPAYLENRRKEECDVWKELVGVARQAPNDPWLMTVVTKQDLWADQQEEVHQFYTDGSYSDVIRDTRSGLGGKKLRHEVAFASFIIQNFVGPADQTLAETVGGFDQKKQIDSIDRLSTLIEELISP